MIVYLSGRPIAPSLLLALCVVGACRRTPEPHAYGNFEATEVVVSAESAGQLERFVPDEGMWIAAGSIAAVVDTIQLALERRQIEAQHQAATLREVEVTQRLRAAEAQLEVARRSYQRTRRLFAATAATAVQLDQAERELRTLQAEFDALRAQQESVALEAASASARVAQIEERIARSVVRNPHSGTVLTTYVEEGEVVQPGQPLYRIADLDTLDLRAYVAGDQLLQLRVGQPATVRVDAGGGELMPVGGVVTWISPSAEFTPTPIQTRDERADLVYAVRVRVPNPQGRLKIGMPADVTFGSAPVPPAGDRGERADSAGAAEEA